MKKFFAILSLVVLAGCGGLVKNENGSEYLVQLDA